MRCSCGALIKSSMKRCRDCAVEFARNIDTDQILVQAAGKARRAVQPRPPHDPQKSGVFQKPTVADWDRREARTRKLWLAGLIAFIVVACGLLAWFVIR